jgi:hypothetical protein
VAGYENSGHEAIYDPSAIAGYNSNSFTFTLLTQMGLANYFGTPGGPLPTNGNFLALPGWNQSVPFL